MTFVIHSEFKNNNGNSAKRQIQLKDDRSSSAAMRYELRLFWQNTYYCELGSGQCQCANTKYIQYTVNSRNCCLFRVHNPPRRGLNSKPSILFAESVGDKGRMRGIRPIATFVTFCQFRFRACAFTHNAFSFLIKSYDRPYQRWVMFFFFIIFYSVYVFRKTKILGTLTLVAKTMSTETRFYF